MLLTHEVCWFVCEYVLRKDESMCGKRTQRSVSKSSCYTPSPLFSRTYPFTLRLVFPDLSSNLTSHQTPTHIACLMLSFTMCSWMKAKSQVLVGLAWAFLYANDVCVWPCTGCRCVKFDDSYKKHKPFGVFTSPNWPTAYEPDIDCLLYTFIGQPNQIVQLSFDSFDLQKPTSSDE